MNTKRGIQLTEGERAICLRRFPQRYTLHHTPQWVTNMAVQRGLFYPPQFLNDIDWLVHTRFAVTDDGKLDLSFPLNGLEGCDSSPTYPHGNSITSFDVPRPL